MNTHYRFFVNSTFISYRMGDATSQNPNGTLEYLVPMGNYINIYIVKKEMIRLKNIIEKEYNMKICVFGLQYLDEISNDLDLKLSLLQRISEK